MSPLPTKKPSPLACAGPCAVPMETRISDDTTHPTTDNRNSANFVIKEFCELRHNGVLGSSSASVWLQLAQYSQTSSVIWSIIKTAEASSTQSLRRSIEHDPLRTQIVYAKPPNSAGALTWQPQ